MKFKSFSFLCSFRVLLFFVVHKGDRIQETDNSQRLENMERPAPWL